MKNERRIQNRGCMHQCHPLERRVFLTATNIDSSFGDEGIAHTTSVLDETSAGQMLLRTPDGKYLVSGPGYNGSFPLVRFSQDGVLDKSFGDHGLFHASTESSDFLYGPVDMQLDPRNGEIVLAGQNQLFFITPDGKRDNSKGTGGLVTLEDLPANLYDISSIAINPDGSIMLAGSINTSAPVYFLPFVAKLTSDYRLDSTFADHGIFRPDTVLGLNGGYPSMSVAADGSIYLFTGRFGSDATTTDLGSLDLAHLHPDGSVDRSFGNNGVLQVASGNNPIRNGMKMAPDGSLYFEWWASQSDPGSALLINHVSATGAFLATSGAAGRDIPLLLGPFLGYSTFGVGPDSSVYTVSPFIPSGLDYGPEDIRIQKLNGALEPDETWAPGGQSESTAIAWSGFSSPIIPQDNQLYLAGGDTQQNMALFRFAPNADLTAGSSGRAVMQSNGTLDVSGTTGADQIHLILSGGTIKLQLNDNSFDFDKANVAAVHVYGGDGNDAIWIGDGIDHVYVSGGAGDDSIQGNDRDNNISGDSGNDRIDGGAGNDFLRGKGGSDTLRGGDGNDSLVGGAGNDRLFGELGEDTLVGNQGHNTLFGGAARDTIYSYPDADTTDTLGDLSGAGLDTTFGQDGFARLDFFGQGGTLAPGGDGKTLILMPSSQDDNSLATTTLVRLNRDGSIDDTFGADGKVERVGSPVASLLSANGDIILLTQDPDAPILTFLKPNGSVDKNIAGTGVVHPRFPNVQARIGATTMTSAPDGKLILGGFFTKKGEDTTYYFVARLNPDGSPDPTFGAGGIVTTESISISTLTSQPIIRVAPDDSVFMLADQESTYSDYDPDYGPDNGVVNQSYLVKFTSAGAIDSGFGDAGKVTLRHDFDEGTLSLGLILRPDGSLTAINPDYGSDFNYAKFAYHILPSGQLDPNETDGRVQIDDFDQMVPASDGGYFTLLTSTTEVNSQFQVLVRRYDVNGNIDRSWNGGVNGATDFVLQSADADFMVGDDDTVTAQGFVGNFQRQLTLMRFGGAGANGREQSAILRTDGTLDLAGTSKADDITLQLRDGQIEADINGSTFTFDASKVTNVLLHSGAGNDRITVTGDINHLYIQGGKGDDTITGGDGSDNISGGAGRDLIDGGVGNDSIRGNAGSDKLISGPGADLINGGAGADKGQFDASDSAVSVELPL